jgi:hypothetical protein
MVIMTIFVPILRINSSGTVCWQIDQCDKHDGELMVYSLPISCISSWIIPVPIPVAEKKSIIN